MDKAYPVAWLQLLCQQLQTQRMHVRRGDGGIITNRLRTIHVGCVQSQQMVVSTKTWIGIQTLVSRRMQAP